MRVFCERTQTRGGGEWGLTTALSSLFSHAESCVSSVMASISTAQTVTLPLLKEHHCPTQRPLRGFGSSFETIEPLTNVKETSVQPAVMSLETHHRWLEQVIEFWRPVIHIDRAIENSNSKDGCRNGWRGAGEVCSLDSGSPCKPLTTSDRLAVGFRICPGRYHFNHVMIQLKLLAYLISRHYGISFPHWKSPHSYCALWMLSAASISVAHPDWIYFFLVYFGEWWK